MSSSPTMSSGSWSINDLVFLSYSRADTEQVSAIADALRARGATVWYDTASTAGGTFYVESVQRALRRTALMLVFVSANSVNSNWVADELRAYRSLMARESGHKLLAVHLDKTRIPVYLQDAGAIDAHGVEPREIARQIGEASGLASLAAPAAPAPATEPAPAAATPEPSAASAASAGSSVYFSYAGSDWARVQPLVTALQARGVRFADATTAGLRSAQTLLVALSNASASSPVVTEDLETFGALAANDPARAIVGVYLDPSAPAHNLNGASAVDASALSADDVAQFIVASLPASALGAATVTPAPTTEAAQEPAPAPAPVAPVDSGPVYFAFAGADYAKAQPLATALKSQGVTLTDNSVGGMREAQTLLVGQSAAAAQSLAVADDLAAFQSIAVGEQTRKIIGVQLESGASAPNLGAASVIDGSFAPADAVAQSIVAALPKRGAPAAEAAPTEAAPALDETAKTPTVVAPAVDHTDAAPAGAAPALDPLQMETNAPVTVVDVPAAAPAPVAEPVAAEPVAETPAVPAAEVAALAATTPAPPQSPEAEKALAAEKADKAAAPNSGLAPFLIGVVILIVAIALALLLAGIVG